MLPDFGDYKLNPLDFCMRLKLNVKLEEITCRGRIFFFLLPSQNATQIKGFFPFLLCFFLSCFQFFSFPYHFDILVLMYIFLPNALSVLKSEIFQYPMLLDEMSCLS